MLAGPSGAGKSRLAARLQDAHGWPIVRLDDFYRDEDDPRMPPQLAGRHRRLGPPGLVERGCGAGRAGAPSSPPAGSRPVYDIAASRAVGSAEDRRRARLDLILAEGIFAADIVPDLRVRRVLAGAAASTTRPVSPSSGGWSATSPSAASRRWCWSAAAWP